MDTSVRKLLSMSQNHKGSGKNVCLLQAYDLLQSVTKSKDSFDSFGQDIFVLTAEIAFQCEQFDIANGCLDTYFQRQQASNQFLIRAYICQAQILAHHDTNVLENFKKAAVHISKATSLAKENQRYHFLVFNASVVYWQICRPFLKPDYRQYIAFSLHQVVKALDDIDDSDYEWRAQLMIALIECHMDAGQQNDASHIALAAAAFTKQHVPFLYKQVFQLMVHNQLVDSSKFHKDIKTSSEFSVLYKLCKLKKSVQCEEHQEYYLELYSILLQLGVVSSRVNIQSSHDRLFRRNTNSSTGLQSPSPHSVSPTNEDSMLISGLTPRKGAQIKPARRTPTQTISMKLNTDNAERPFFVLEVAHLCLDLGFTDLASDCMEHLRSCKSKGQQVSLHLEFFECLLMVKKLGEKQESCHSHVVDLRLQAIKRCEEALMNSIRIADPDAIQTGCVTLWNLCMPLLQPNLRHHIRKPLKLLSESLEDKQSLLIKLRCQVHMELAKCEEDVEQIQVAMEHLKKALQLDDGDAHKERLEVSLRRLQLCYELYQQPEQSEDEAAMIIEQARKSDCGTVQMKRSLLVKAGEILAPDAFLVVMGSEVDLSEDLSGQPMSMTIKRWADMARTHISCVSKADGHLNRLGDKCDRVRSRLWADLAKTARRQEVWDVCRVAARFCLLYDDGRWKVSIPKPAMARREYSNTEIKEDNIGRKQVSRMSNKVLPPVDSIFTYDKDLIRNLAEASFLFGEGIVHLLRSIGLQLNDKPTLPVDKSKHAKGYVARNADDDSEWKEYCDWIGDLSKFCTEAFIRGLELGVDLGESWLVCSAITYLWNHNNHILSHDRQREIVPTLTTIFEALKKFGHVGELAMLVRICTALANGLISQWLPNDPKEEKAETMSVAEIHCRTSKTSKSKQNAFSAKTKSIAVIISPDALPDVKKALEVCEYAISATSGDDPLYLVPIAVRQPLLREWVVAKQLAQQQISKALGTDDHSSMEGQMLVTRSIVATEMLTANKNCIFDFKETPTISEVANMVERCDWSDHFVELQLWIRLTALAFEDSLHTVVMHCSGKALNLASLFCDKDKPPRDRDQDIEGLKMLSHVSILQGLSLISNVSGRFSHQALTSFLNGCRFARKANNYEMVMNCTRHFWNASVPVISQQMERGLLKEQLKMILEYIAETADINAMREQFQAVSDQNSRDSITSTNIKQDESNILLNHASSCTSTNINDELRLWAAMYGVLIQIYSDEGDWETAMVVINQAIKQLPRTRHRLLVFKHRTLLKAKFGQSIQADIQKFSDESEEIVSELWRQVALISKDIPDQLSAHQTAIETLTRSENDFQKVDYLIEFGQWLYSNEFSMVDTLDMIEWAVDILLDMHAFQKASICSIENRKANKSATKRVSKKRSRSSALSQSSSKEHVKLSSAVKQAPHKHCRESGLTINNRDSEINVTDYVPVKKEVVIGVSPNNSNLGISSLSDVRQLDALIRTHVILAELVSLDGDKHKDVVVQAYGYVMQLWKVLLKAAVLVIKEFSKDVSSQAKDTSAKGAKTNDKVRSGKEKEAAPVRDKVKRRSLLDALPRTFEEWSTYDASDETVEAFQHGAMKATGLNQNTVPKPMLTMYYMTLLTKLLRKLGYSHLTLPVLALQDVMTRSILKNHSLFILVHVRSMEACLELNLLTGVEFHESLVGSARIREEDQAISRIEIEVFKEKQSNLLKQKMNITTDSVSSVPSESSKCNSLRDRTHPGQAVTCNGEVLGAVRNCVVWTDIAEVLIRLGYYQRAHEYLDEANRAAKGYSDVYLCAHIMLLFGKLSFEEAQYGLAAQYCAQSQIIFEGDELFWFESVQLLVDATLHDDTHLKGDKDAEYILSCAINEFRKVAINRPNRAGWLEAMVTVMEAKLVDVKMTSVLNQNADVNHPDIMTDILSLCKNVSNLVERLAVFSPMSHVTIHSQNLSNSVEKLVHFGQCRDAVPLMIRHASCLTALARSSTEVGIQHSSYLEALRVMQQAVAMAEEIYLDALSLCPPHELPQVSLPVQRELCSTLLQQADLLNEIAGVHVTEMRLLRLAEERKNSIQRFVEDYVVDTPVHTCGTSSNWLTNRITVFDMALATCVTAHNMSSCITDLRAQSLASLGKCLRLLAEHKDADPPSHWLIHKMEMLAEVDDIKSKNGQDTKFKVCKDSQIMSEAVSCCDECVLSKKVASAAKTNVEKYKNSTQYYAYSTECLFQALNLALIKKHTSVASQAALELVKCFGQHDPSTATQFLALFQSCQVSLRLEDLLLSAHKDPTTSRFSALLHQRQRLLSHNHTTNLVSSSMFNVNCRALMKDWQAWKMLDILPNHTNLLKEFPANFNFIILQHSPDKRFLFTAVMDKPCSVNPDKGKFNLKPTTSSSSGAKIFCTETSSKLLKDVKSRCVHYKQRVQALLLKQEYRRLQTARKQKMMEKWNDNFTSFIAVQDANAEEEKQLEEEFKDLVAITENYLNPILTAVEQLFGYEAARNECGKDEAGEYVVLLADADLMQLPLEALSCFRFHAISGLSRDFSLQCLHHRFRHTPTEHSVAVKTKCNESALTMSRIPGARDTKTKLAKIIPLLRHVQPWQLAVDCTNFRYVVDPNQECAENEECLPIGEFCNQLEKYEQQFTPRWLGVTGEDHVPSVGEFEIYIKESSSFIFYGMERLLSYLSPARMSALNIPGCMIMYVLDLAQTSMSCRRQSKADILKSKQDVLLEDPLHTAIFVSLSGTRCLLANQWNCTLKENSHKMAMTLRDLLANGRTTGETVRLLFSPSKRREEESVRDEENVTSREEEDGRGSGGGGKHKPEPNSNIKRNGDQIKKKHNASGIVEKRVAKNGYRSLKTDDASMTVDTVDGEMMEDDVQQTDGGVSVIQRSWFNLVCYGMPNLVITQ